MPRFAFGSRVLAIVLLAGCTSGGGAGRAPEPEPDEMEPEDESTRVDLAGGNSGGEGSFGPCVETRTSLALDAIDERLGFSAEDMLALARSGEVTMRWHARDSGPEIAPLEDTLRVGVEPSSDMATAFHCNQPGYPEQYRPPPRLEVPITLTLQTADRMLDERFETVLAATFAERAGITTIEVDPEELAGGLGAAVAAFYSGNPRTLMFELAFSANGPAGWIGGPFSPHTEHPCAYTEYASWPADAECWPGTDALPPDEDALERYLQLANRTFELTWDDGEVTDATLSVEPTDGPLCGVDASVQQAVLIRLVSEDGRVDLALPGTIVGAPNGVDPWPAQHADVEPFYLDVSGSVALDGDGLRDGLSIEDPDVATAIVSLYVSSPVAIDSPLLGGGLRAVAIDRAGFSTPLPTVALPGGWSERCFDSDGDVQTLIQADLALK